MVVACETVGEEASSDGDLELPGLSIDANSERWIACDLEHAESETMAVLCEGSGRSFLRTLRRNFAPGGTERSWRTLASPRLIQTVGEKTRYLAQSFVHSLHACIAVGVSHPPHGTDEGPSGLS